MGTGRVQEADGGVAAATGSRTWERYAWLAGIVFVIAFVGETAVAVGIPLDHRDSAAKIAAGLDEHRRRLVLIACLSVVYAPMFAIFLTGLQDLLRRHVDGGRVLLTWVLVGGVLFVSLHGVSDIGITGLLGAKLASYSAQHDPGVSYSLYLLTYALDSVGDVFGSLFAFAAGVLVLRSGVLPRWLGWTSMLVAPFFFVQGFGLGGVIGTFGLVLDLVGFLLFLIFVLSSSGLLLARRNAAHPSPAGATA